MSLPPINYCRKSEEDKDRQVLSIEGQLRIGVELKEEHKLPDFLCDPIIDEKSAKKPHKRVGFNKMVKLFYAGKSDTIICWRNNRLARNAKEAGIIIDLVDNHNVKIINELGIFDKNNTKLIWMDMIEATEYSKSLSKDVKVGLETKRLMGHASQKAYLGYRNTPEKEKGSKTIEVDPERWDLVRYWHDLILSEKYTVMESLEIITEKGLRTRPTKKHPTPEVISKTTAYRTLGNIFYTGRFKSRGEIVENGQHKRMITDEEYLKIQRIIKGNPHKEIEQEDPLPFKGFIKCGECGRTITGDKKSKFVKKLGTNKLFAHYRCTDQKTIKGPKTCTQPHMEASKLNEQVKGYLDRLEIDPDFIQLVRDTMKRRNAQEFELEKKQKELQTKQLQALLSEKKELIALKIEGDLDPEEYRIEMDKLNNKGIQIKSYLNRDGTAYWESVIDETLDFAQTIRDRFASGDINQKILVLKTLSSELTIKDGKLDLSPKYAFMFLKEAENQAKSGNGSIGLESDLENGALEGQKPFGASV